VGMQFSAAGIAIEKNSAYSLGRGTRPDIPYGYSQGRSLQRRRAVESIRFKMLQMSCFEPA
jgi:hypothetical protein